MFRTHKVTFCCRNYLDAFIVWANGDGMSRHECLNKPVYMVEKQVEKMLREGRKVSQ